ncbi:transporter substrate-binding domain-containing protein [Aureimonas fodinaquatilis]|uniref:Transporter substrate-binding domain-containing protein n=1 Tax=Aureimonas fodinaquatilis TaxID=2565783 RepID=A0A5B0DST0_9HYPH|nr:transporter substrate-binding domain-containing protein [Aureimonas fodinaquatilis]KAA0969448.1 transporter substrate-binding domain-containing protein [Aureimonas fodinaquatilis]
MTEKRQFFRAVIGALVIAFAMPGAASAQNLLEQIKSAGEIRVGLEFGRPPWGYKDANLQSAGYDFDAAKLIAEELGVNLTIVELTQPNRIPFLTSGRVDAVISTFSITPEREKVVDFSIPYGSAIVGVAGPQDLAISSTADLKGVRVGVVRGSTNDTALTAQAPDADIVRFDDEATNMTAFVSGQVQAAVTEPATLKSIVEQNPNRNLELKFTLVEFPIGVGLRKEEPELKEALNAAISKNLEGGSLNEAFQGYFGTQLPETIQAR